MKKIEKITIIFKRIFGLIQTAMLYQKKKIQILWNKDLQWVILTNASTSKEIIVILYFALSVDDAFWFDTGKIWPNIQ